MEKGDVRIPVAILLMLAVFIIVLYVIYHIFGSPECDDLTNQTAYQLMNSINTVSKDDFQIWMKPGEVPKDDDVGYYAVAPIKLCQKNYGDYESFLKLHGGEPEYKIYYEKFPEGGLMWSEAYPWSGGQASTITFWAEMKAIQLAPSALGLLWKTLKRVWTLKKIADLMDGAEYSLFDAVFRPKKLLENTDLKDKVLDFMKLGQKDISQLSETLTKKQFQGMVNTLADNGILEKTAGGGILVKGGKIIPSSVERPLTAATKEFDEVTGEWTTDYNKLTIGYEKSGACQGCLNLDNPNSAKAFWYNYQTDTIIDPDTGLPADENKYFIPKANPMGEYHDLDSEVLGPSNLPSFREDSNVLNENFEFYNPSGATTFSTSWAGFDGSDGLAQTNWYNTFYTLGPMKVNEGLGQLAEGIAIEDKIVKFSTKGPGAIMSFQFAIDEDGLGGLNGLKEIFDDPAMSDIKTDIITTIQQPYTGIEDKVSAITGKFSVTDVDYEEALFSQDFGLWNYVSPNFAEGPIVAAMPTDWQYRVYDQLGRLIAFQSLADEDEAWTAISSMPNFADITSLGVTDAEKELAVKNIFNKEYNFYTVNNVGALPDDLSKIKKMNEGVTLEYFTEWHNTKDINPGFALEGESFLVGLYKADSRPWYSKFQKISANSWKWKRVAKTVWFRARELVTPTSPYARGVLMKQTEGCAGNSLCVYSHGALSEYPFYLSEDAKNFEGNVRLWRPVELWSRLSATSGLLEQVPEHPRFHLVGPCFAKAKIWKTNYNGESTIFIRAEKFDLNDTASNYCYADTDLINGYSAIWLASDLMEAAQFIFMASKQSSSTTIKSFVDNKFVKLFDFLDPATLFRAAAEYFISWPEAPFKPLSWEQMVSGAASVPVAEGKQAKEKAEHPV